MSDSVAIPLNIVRADVVRDFARSELFDRTFKEGMALVEETAAYLDGEGRRDSRMLDRDTALAYAGESMRLTTRLMQIASWLLVQRAVREGDMDAAEACQDRYRVTQIVAHNPATPSDGSTLPEGLLVLLDRATRLYERVTYLDQRMFADDSAAAPEALNPVLTQMQRLQEAFGG